METTLPHADAALAGPSRAPAAPRLVALDAFRGLTIAGMILVNNPGSWSHVYAPLRHADWHGLTPTDLVFPFFLFIVGVALPLSFDRRVAAGAARVGLFLHALRRSALLFVLGLVLASWPKWPLLVALFGVGGWDWQGWRHVLPYLAATLGLILAGAHGARRIVGLIIVAAAATWWAVELPWFHEHALRVPGVLQRIAVCYCAAAVVYLLASSLRPAAAQVARAAITVALLVLYCLLVTQVAAPADHTMPLIEQRPDGVLHDWVDEQLLAGHLYRERPDPEGLLSTLPALATVLLGALAGSWLTRRPDPQVSHALSVRDRVGWLFVAANGLLLAGLWLGFWFPVNKKIWSASYVLVTAGLALHGLGICLWLIDVHGLRRWAAPLLVFGTNAITVYVASSIGARVLTTATVLVGDQSTDLRTLAFRGLADSLPAELASLVYALAYVTLWCVLFIPLYRRRIFIRI